MRKFGHGPPETCSSRMCRCKHYKGIVQAMVITKPVWRARPVFSWMRENVEVNHHRFFCCKLFELHLVEQTLFENNPRILEALLVLVLLGSCRSSRRGSHGMRMACAQHVSITARSWENCPEEPREQWQSEDYVLVRFAIDQALGAIFTLCVSVHRILAHIYIITVCIYMAFITVYNHF